MATDETVQPACSFCGKTSTEVKKLIAGPDGNICSSCVADALTLVLALELERPGKENIDALTVAAPEAQAAASCSFCGKRGGEVAFLFSGSRVNICSECVRLCEDICDEHSREMCNMGALKSIEEYGVVPVVALEEIDHALPLADALIAGGLPVVEVTFRTQVAAKVIKTLRYERPQLTVGAGTVLSLDNVEAALEARAQFLVAPGTSKDVIRRTHGRPFIPGVATPSEIEAALGLGCTLLKFFPAEALGGVKMLKAMHAPYAHTGVRFMPTGGIGPANLEEYLALKAVAAVGGTWIATKEDIAQGRWDDISAKCREALTIASRARG